MSNSKWNKPYIIGYDLGNRTVASTVINQDYNVVRQNGHVMSTVNVFSEGQSKQERRAYRSTRRAIAHKKWLKKQLYRYFRARFKQIGEVDKIDEVQRRFKTSWISKRDKSRANQKSVKQLYLLRTDLYPTVWHAVDALIKNDERRLPEKADDRMILIYEVFHNLLNRRGHFLMPNLKVAAFSNQSFDFGDLLKQLNQSTQDVLGLAINEDLAKFKYAMTMTAGITRRKDALVEAIQNQNLDKTSQSRIKYLATLCVGGTLSGKQLMKLFNLNHELVSKLQLGSGDYDTQFDVVSKDLSDNDLALIQLCNQIYYQSQLSFLIKPGKSFVDVQLDNYQQFGKDLVMMKRTILPNLKSDKDRDKFKKELNQYLNSYGQVRDRNRRQILKRGKADKELATLMQKNFINEVLKKLPKAKYQRDLVDLIGQENIDRMNNGDFLVKTRSVQNARIPEQAVQAVVRKIIDVQKNVPGLVWFGEQNHADKWFPDEKYDLERFFDFRIPYYVGPLVHNTDQSEFSWLVRKESGTLTVFNFTQKVDLMKSASRFIERLQAKDTYLLDEPVMPASTMTYQKFAVLDELNRLSIKENTYYRKLYDDEKQSLLDLFKQTKTVPLLAAFRKLQTECNTCAGIDEDDAFKHLIGLSKTPELQNKAKFNNSLLTYHKWKDSYGFTDQEIEKHYDDFEDIAEILTVFDQDSKLIKRSVLSKFDWLNSEQIDKLSRDHLEGWGRLSKKLLCEIKDKDGNSVLDLMKDTQQTFNQVIADTTIKKQINQHREKVLSKAKTRRQAIDGLLDRSYASPAVRKVVHRFAGSLTGIIKQMRFAPKMVVIESARVSGTSSLRGDLIANRQISKVVNKLDPKVVDDWKSLSSEEKRHLRLSQELYFLQNGRDIYSGKTLDFNNLSNSTNIDHIVPQHLHKDDSLDNKVLTIGVNNNIKSGNMCAIKSITGDRQYVLSFWRRLRKQGLITNAKYQNLMSDWTKPVSDRVGKRMLKRSLVETHQVNKLCAQIATMLLGNKGTKVLTLRASITTFLRSETQFDNTKNRVANDLHHGVDAFLIAFAGQYLWAKYDWLHSILDYNDYNKIELPDGFRIQDVGFGQLFKKNGDLDEIFVNRSTGEIIGKRGQLLDRLNSFDMNIINVRYETGLAAIPDGETLGQATIYPAKHLRNNQNYLLVQGHDPSIYGYRQGAVNRKMVLIRMTKGQKQGMYRFINVPRNKENDVRQYVDSQVKNAEIVRDDLVVGDEFTIPGTSLRFAANGRYFNLRNEIHYSTKLLKRINKLDQLTADDLKVLIGQIIYQVKSQYSYAISHNLNGDFTKLGELNVDVELAKETDVNHLREIVNDLLIGFNCSKDRVKKLQIGDMTFSYLGMWTKQYWSNVKIVRR